MIESTQSLRLTTLKGETMKKTIIAVLALAAPSAFACPELANTYVCATSEGDKEVTIEQAVESDVTTYTLRSGEQTIVRVMDGAAHEEVTEDQTLTYTATCDGDKSAQSVEHAVIPAYSAEVDSVTVLSLDGKDLVISVKGEVHQGGKDYPIEQTLTCALK